MKLTVSPIQTGNRLRTALLILTGRCRNGIADGGDITIGAAYPFDCAARRPPQHRRDGGGYI